MKACGTADARVIIVTRNNFCALAVGDEGAVMPTSYTRRQAKAVATLPGVFQIQADQLLRRCHRLCRQLSSLREEIEQIDEDIPLLAA